LNCHPQIWPNAEAMAGDGNPAVAEPLTSGFARTSVEQEETAAERHK
jgi:hypothetical protein